MYQGGDCSVVFYVRIGGALMAPFFFGGWCIRDLVLCHCMTGGITLTFVFFGAKWLDALGLLFRTDKTI